MRIVVSIVVTLLSVPLCVMGAANSVDSSGVLEFRGYLTTGGTTLYRIDVVDEQQVARGGWFRINDVISDRTIQSFELASETLFLTKGRQVYALRLKRQAPNSRSLDASTEKRSREAEESVEFNNRIQIKVAAITQIRAERLQTEGEASASAR